MGVTAPFGMAYGVGAGLAGWEEARRKAEENANNLSMQNMRLQKMQQDQQDESDTRDIMSSPFTPKQDTTVDANNPVYAQQQEADTAQTDANQASVDELGDEGQGQQAPEYSTAPTAPKTVEKTISAYTTPQQKLADEYRQKAQMLRSKGLWRSAEQLENVASQNEDKHMTLARRGLSDAILNNNSDKIINYLHGMGASNAVGAEKTEDGGLVVTSRDPDGSPHEVELNSNEVTQLISGKDPGEIWKTATGRYMQGRALDDRKSEGALNRDSREKMAANRLSSAGKAQGKTPAKILEAQYYAKSLIRYRGMDPVDAANIADDRIFNGKTEGLNPKDEIRTLQMQIKDMSGFSDIPGRPEFEAKKAVQKKIDDLVGKFGSASNGTTTPKNTATTR